MAAGSIRLMIDTQETIKPTDSAQLMSYINQPGWFTFNVHQIEAEDIVDLPPVTKTEKKSKSYTLRTVLYRIWEQNNAGFSEFKDYYDMLMDKIIEHYKEKI
jgi:hypothetical protein